MKTNNPFIDTLVESQTQFVNNWMESAKKMQSAFTNGSIASEGQALYKEYFDKQMGVFNQMKDSAAGMFGTSAGNPQEFFKNWFNQQATYAKQMADFNQSINNSVMNFGKPASEYMSNFGQANTAFTNIYNNWLNALNSTYDTLSRNLGNGFPKEVFGSYMQGNQLFAKMQEFFQPMMNAIQKGQFNAESYKNFFSSEQYNALAKQMFAGLYDQNNIKEWYDSAIRQLQNFFAGQNNLGREYMEQMQQIAKEFPNLTGNNTASASMGEFYQKMNNIFGKTFEPLMKLVNPGKEKENAEALISLMDRIAAYSIKQAELQAHLQSTTREGLENIAKQYAEKYNNPEALKNLPTPQEMYNEWVKVNDQLFTELFASEAFSKAKGEALNLTNEVKKHFEKQFEQMFSNFPFVFKSEVEELEKTIYDLRKQVKELQHKLAMGNGSAEPAEEEKTGKSRKKQ